MNISYHTHVPVDIENGKIKIASFMGREIDSFAKYFDTVVLWCYRANKGEQREANYTLNSENIYFKDLGLHDSVPNRLIRFLKFLRSYKSEFNKTDLLLVRAPTPLVVLFSLFFQRKKIVLFLVGDYTKNTSDLQFGWVKNKLIVFFSRLVDCAEFHLIRRQLFITNSQELLNKYGSVSDLGVLIRTTTLFEGDFRLRKFCYDKSKPLKIIYVGRIDYSKGILEIIDACKLLLAHGIEVELNLVGPVVKNIPSVDSRIQQQIAGTQMLGKVKYHGIKKVGDELFEIYRECHIFILASKSEGFPRVIWEAFANSVPVVTSRVGSIPYFLQENTHALFLENISPVEICRKIESLINNPMVTNEMIIKAYDLAKSNTLEHLAEELYATLKININKANQVI